jgi:hypothetical protein
VSVSVTEALKDSEEWQDNRYVCRRKSIMLGPRADDLTASDWALVD